MKSPRLILCPVVAINSCKQSKSSFGFWVVQLWPTFNGLNFKLVSANPVLAWFIPAACWVSLFLRQPNPVLDSAAFGKSVERWLAFPNILIKGPFRPIQSWQKASPKLVSLMNAPISTVIISSIYKTVSEHERPTINNRCFSLRLKAPSKNRLITATRV